MFPSLRKVLDRADALFSTPSLPHHVAAALPSAHTTVTLELTLEQICAIEEAESLARSAE